MTRIDFYLDAPDRLEVACRLAAKAAQAKARMLIFAPDEGIAARVNRQLWTLMPTGFIPHCMSNDALAPETPILIARNVDEPPLDDIILNLADEPPPTFARFQRVLEIVSQDETEKALARERFRFYRDRGYRIDTHSLNKSASGEAA